MRAAFAALILLALSCGVHAEFNGCPRGPCNKPVQGGGGAYVGPKDAQSKSALVYYSPARGYSAAYATAGGNAIEVCNPSDAACAVVPVSSNGKVTVPLIGGVNCATSTCTIRTLYDQSGANSCSGAACNLVITAINDRPTLTMSALNGLACMTTSSTTNIVTATFAGVAQPFTMSAVAINGASSPGGILGDNGNVGFFDNGTNWGFFASSNFSDGPSDATTYHSFQFTAASTPRIVVDSSTTTGTANQAGTAAFGTTLRTGSDAYSRWTGKICELGLWSGFSTTDDTNMTSNQHGSNGYAF